MTLRELAILANVSKATASRAFSNSGEISEETRQHVFRVAKEHNCYDKFQKGLYFKKVIAVICPDIRGDYYNNMISHLDTMIANSGANMVLSISYYDAAKEEAICSYHAHYQKVDGIIIISSQAEHKYDYSIPIVYIDTIEQETDSVCADWKTGIESAISLFMEKGHRRIAYVGDTLSSVRLKYFKSAMKKYALPIRDEYVVIENERREKDGYDCMKRILELPDKPTAILVAYDYMAMGVYKCIIENNLSVPEDFSIIGMENINTKDFLEVPITSIYGRTRDKCQIAMNLLLKKMDNMRYSEPRVMLDTKIIPRKSVKDLRK